MIPGLAAVAGHGVAMDADESLGLADAAPLGDVLQDGRGLLRRQVGAEQRRALAPGEPVAAGAAAEESDRRGLAVVAADGEVSPAADAMIGALGIQAAGRREVIHGPPRATYPVTGAYGCDSVSG
jgi:hypothetical protein